MTAPSETPPRPDRRRAVQVRFLAGTRQDFFLDELPAILRHPVVLLYFAGSISICFTVSVLLGKAGMPSYALLVPVLAVATVIGLIAFGGWIILATLFRRGHDPVRIYLSAPLALCIVTVQTLTLGLWNLKLGLPTAALPVTLVALLLTYLLDEALMNLIVAPNAKRVIEDVRSFGQPAPRRPPAAPHPPEGPRLVAGNQQHPVTAVLHLQAQGNYVQIRTDCGTFQVPGPFAALVAQLPEGLGCRVHRSEWVATRAVVSARRDGRVTELLLTTGATVRVASTRAGDVRDWLARFTARPARRRAQPAGGGETKRHSRPAPEITTSAMGGTAPAMPSAPVTSTNS